VLFPDAAAAPATAATAAAAAPVSCLQLQVAIPWT
jgi:hypothetical protein